MLIAWTWNQLAHESGTFASMMIATVCIAYLAHRGASVLRTRERKLRDQGIATGLTCGVRENRRRFSLLDMFVVLTLAGALAGLIRGIAGEDKNGMPYRFGDEWDWHRNSDDATQREK